jgi:hypothetical protein
MSRSYPPCHLHGNRGTVLLYVYGGKEPWPHNHRICVDETSLPYFITSGHSCVGIMLGVEEMEGRRNSGMINRRQQKPIAEEMSLESYTR